jgi:putative membrane protein
MRLLVSWLILSLAVWATASVVPGFHVKSFKSAILVAAIFGLLNFLLGWMLFALLTVVTLGLAWLFAFITNWVINALMLKVTDAMTDHLKIDGMGTAFVGALLISIISTVTQWVVF